MIVEKRITTTQSINMQLTDIGLLSRDEYLLNKDIIPRTLDSWWLCSPGDSCRYALIVTCMGSIANNSVKSPNGIRPVLIGNFKDSGFLRGDKLQIINFTWTVLTDTLALCDKVIDETNFRNTDFKKDSNDFNVSDIKQWLYNWADEKIFSLQCE